MKKITELVVLVFVFLFAGSAIAADKVVVVPLSSNKILEYTEEFEAESSRGYPAYVDLKTEPGKGICFLVKVSSLSEDTDNGYNQDICEIFINEGTWTLKAYAGFNTLTTVCKARCLTW